MDAVIGKRLEQANPCPVYPLEPGNEAARVCDAHDRSLHHMIVRLRKQLREADRLDRVGEPWDAGMQSESKAAIRESKRY